MIMSDNEYLQDKKYILESIREHKDDIKALYNNDVDIKLTLRTLVVKMAGVVFVAASITSGVIGMMFTLAK